MNKQTMVRELEKFSKEKGVITRAELARYLKMKPQNAEKYVKGADYIPGRNRKFFISDIANNLLAVKETG